MSVVMFAYAGFEVVAIASYLAFRRHRAAHPGEFTGFSVRGGDKLAVVAGLGVLAVAATAVKVPDMRQAAVIGIAFTLALLTCYALTARRRP
ncbi:amino acid permease, partial [Streptomyces sp. NPDC006324]